MTKNPQLKIGLTGHFSIDIYNPETGEHREYEFDNLITNGGLERLGTAGSGFVVDYVQVGTGSTAPANTDSALANWLAGTRRISGGGTGPTVTASYGGNPTYHTETTYTWEFDQGAAAGNLSEIGVGWASSGSLFSRALIVDGSNNPTTITVQAIEFLTVTYKLRMYPPTADVTGTITLDGADYDYIIRPAYAGGSTWASQGRRAYASAAANYAASYTGDIGAMTAGPSGTTSGALYAAADAYSAGSYKRTIGFDAGINTWNLAGGIRSVAFYPAGYGNENQMGWQCQFDPKIPKDNTKELSLTFDVSWARKP